ncbi:MAG TPA: hypothetical protein VK700_07820 [Steroidobacteraceae bacterium]|jgi:hypothetical protein|nr:hypothetical protein [Steroidobacteraceae bacterium]
MSNNQTLRPPAVAQLGKVIHDPRGNAIWDWTIETGVLAKATVAELLGKLVDPMPMALEHEMDRGAHWCGDPYNRSR